MRGTAEPLTAPALGHAVAAARNHCTTTLSHVGLFSVTSQRGGLPLGGVRACI